MMYVLLPWWAWGMRGRFRQQGDVCARVVDNHHTRKAFLCRQFLDVRKYAALVCFPFLYSYASPLFLQCCLNNYQFVKIKLAHCGRDPKVCSCIDVGLVPCFLQGLCHNVPLTFHWCWSRALLSAGLVPRRASYISLMLVLCRLCRLCHDMPLTFHWCWSCALLSAKLWPHCASYISGGLSQHCASRALFYAGLWIATCSVILSWPRWTKLSPSHPHQRTCCCTLRCAKAPGLRWRYDVCAAKVRCVWLEGIICVHLRYDVCALKVRCVCIEGTMCVCALKVRCACALKVWCVYVDWR